jgi:acyl carrier protein
MDVENLVKDIFFESFPTLSESDFSWDKEQKDYENWDSFAQLNLITLAEAKFDISFSLDEAIEIKSANDLLNSIRSHLS